MEVTAWVRGGGPGLTCEARREGCMGARLPVAEPGLSQPYPCMPVPVLFPLQIPGARWGSPNTSCLCSGLPGGGWTWRHMLGPCTDAQTSGRPPPRAFFLSPSLPAGPAPLCPSVRGQLGQGGSQGGARRRCINHYWRRPQP